MRVDVRTLDGAWAHRYDEEVSCGARAPQGPFAMYLADETGFRFLVFDLDTKTGGPAQVLADMRTLAALLDRAGLAFFTVASGPGGGRHLWVPVHDRSGRGADPQLVRDIARAARQHCPSLDISALCNPVSGCVRPPGSLHRLGGYARLLFPTHPADALDLCGASNHHAKLGELSRLLGPPPPETDQLTDGGGTIDLAARALVGRWRPMSAAQAALLDEAPVDASAHLARILVGLALSRWSQDQVVDLVARHAGAPGLEHLRSQGGPGRRRRRGPSEQRAVLVRQWARALAFASRLPHRVPHPGEDTEQVRGLVEQAARVWEATWWESWWRPQAGASDLKALLFVAQMTLEALAPEVEVDCRRLADATGMTASTASRALRRLRMDGRLELVRSGEGPRAHTYRLVRVEDWRIRVVRTGSPRGGTQATPAPATPVPEETRDGLVGQIRARLEHAAHEVWTEPGPGGRGGLGRHLERSAAALALLAPLAQDRVVQALSRRTGYTPKTTARHLGRLLALHLAEVEGGRWTLRPDRYDRAATRLRTSGTRGRRMRRYTAERRAWAAWCRELALLRSPGTLVRLSGPRYPRTPSGRPDHRAARGCAA
ncbi:hypothetical protein [Nocardiopsis sp. NRRL B-16309]|uniref:hypothetical protein n=1 Tax=Nocardiopsis sp. NRRL B-16309 TaxID=1519494 RepID=UPI0006AE34EE|nr:hypothetical protein [Nocardiopsis sp. NRRL B-16309]KOX11013.1 hypothetical protein ADL05_24425 [Nocardiopsis sp. NRRL B-16309]